MVIDILAIILFLKGTVLTVTGYCQLSMFWSTAQFRNQRRKYHLEGKSIGAILDDVGSLVGYLQDIKVFKTFVLFLFIFKYFLYIVL